MLAAAARRVAVSVTLSIGTLDEDIWRKTEPATAHPRQRLRALERLSAAGIRTGVSVAPILPGLTDRREQVEAVVRAARDAGADFLFCNPLHLQPGTREYFLERLTEDWPELVPEYLLLYRERGYLREADAAPMRRLVEGLREEAGIANEREGPPPPEAGQGLRQLALL
jgi:DNA repair photolyase